ncbi:8-amino-7-oxononanoate synthase [Parachitinimonas caeni]|uniref:8-amino-7-oxononanoate synthase n=1 Tax=Parachitinimonas caeni TaxID=3031301 RepID=A0ABT7DUK5_9NEIS|nr:8-amino-7-oxononanoate synthase [Parachitinimonas caeni]MDK2123753.1 8-amino-7-oxononanoate synthase [Parachitinimonas caeni]
MPFHSLAQELQHLDDAHLRRQRRIVDSAQGAKVIVNGQTLLNFCSNDYLGLAADGDLASHLADATHKWGVGSGASHLVCGHQAPHEALERALAAFIGTEAALGFGTGYLANLGVLTALAGREDAIFADKLNHASLNEGALLSRADFKRFPHNDLATLERQLASSMARRKLIAVDGVFSMDGDLAPLPDLLALAARYDAWLYVDDAHGFGVLGESGQGSLQHWGLMQHPERERLIYMATLGKAAGTAGAFVAGPQVLVDYLLNRARSYIYTTAAPAALAAASQLALRKLEEEHWRRQRLQAHIAALRHGLATTRYRLANSTTAIQPIEVASAAAALALSAALQQHGLWVAAIRPPTVPTPRLRITLSAAHTADDVAYLIATLKQLEGMLDS